MPLFAIEPVAWDPPPARAFDALLLTSANALDMLRDYDVIVDGSDNFPTRYLVNDACVLLGKPDVYGSIHRFEGQAAVFWAARGPCYRCLYREPPPPELVVCPPPEEVVCPPPPPIAFSYARNASNSILRSILLMRTTESEI